MTILLTNDDGIYAPGIYAIYKELSKWADVLVAAPDSERSSVGHGITLAHPIFYKKIHRKNKFFGYGISGTPADCVKFATNVLLKGKKPDAIVSGINLGDNDGCSVFYSGTVAGAREGALLGIPSMAISLACFMDADFRYAAQCGSRIAKRLIDTTIPKGTFLNVNVPDVPASQIRGIKVTAQGQTPIHSTFRKRKDPHLREYYWMSGKVPVKSKDNSVDTNALHNRYVTITPILSDTTDYVFLNEIQPWEKFA